jgi:esterase/lipase superfamily enzyme
VREKTVLKTELSRRGVLRAGAVAACAAALPGCANVIAGGTKYDASDLAADPTLLVATNRKPIGGAREEPWFGAERGALSTARVILTPPDDGRFSLASVGLDHWRIARVERLADVGDLFRLASQRDLLLYVHGYNTNFESAALDAVKLSDGIRFHGHTMVFTWPSRAKLLDYGYDRESAMWSRDALERTADSILASPSVGTVHIVAHSIGTMVTMEALRQLYTRHGEAATARIGSIVFASPDIDMDVFSASVERIGGLAPKITIVTATNDRALSVSRWIAGGMTRVGAAEKAQLERLGLRVIDASQQGWGIINHDLFLSNTEIRQVIRRAIDGRLAGRALGGVAAQPL